MEEIKVIEIVDLNLASVLLTIGFDISGMGISPKNPSTKMFIFKETPELKTAMSDYVSRKLMVEPNALFYSRKQILKKIYDNPSSQE